MLTKLPSQSYESIFGRHSTLWIIQWENLDFGGIDSIVVQKDTMIGDISWKKIVSTQPFGWQGGLLREDTLSGKIWYRPLEFQAEVEYLAFDFSLVTGDTFDLRSNYNWVAAGVVDSTYWLDSTKHIRFDAYVHPGDPEPITWIEGVSGNQGPIYKQSNGWIWPYLLCAFKDGRQTYSNIRHDGDCNPIISRLTLLELPLYINVYPNPFESDMHIETSPGVDFAYMEIMDTGGRIVYSDRFRKSIETPDLKAGPYFLRLVTDDGREISKVIIKK